ncbi:MAG: NADPH:quinone reductase, partial [Ilumatobacteraceae bacterium]|nr:NADPH:quinone reductase [Ilumatobacteraceae bacterium]
LVQVVATSINPGEAKIREGLLHDRWPSTFPSGQGSDLAGRVAGVGHGVEGLEVGDEVFGFANDRSAQAELVAVPAGQLTHKPAGVSFEVAGSLFVAGTTAFAAVRAVDLHAGDTVVVSGAAGGVGSLAVQLAKRLGARVIGIAGPDNQDWLRSFGVEPVVYGDGLAERIRAAAPNGIDAFVDTHGSGYVRLALDLGVDRERIDTIADFAAIAELGVKGDGNAAGADVEVLDQLAALVADHELVVTIAATYPLDEVRAAYAELERGHTRGKIVLLSGA